MGELLITKRLSLVPTMHCTLRCKLCSNHMPEFKSPQDVPVDDIIRDVDDLFLLFDRIEWLQFVGGEIFLHKDMAKVYRYCMKYQDKFDKLILETNATLLPREKELDVFEEYGDRIKVMISDYGTVSRRKTEFMSLLDERKIPYITKKYYGEDQHFGGWIDNTGLKDLGESSEEIFKKAAGCPQVRIQNMHCYQGKLHRCSNSLFLYELGLFEPNPHDFLNLRDDLLSFDEKREIIKQFYQYPRKSCSFCSWKNIESMPRFPAAEQIN